MTDPRRRQTPNPRYAVHTCVEGVEKPLDGLVGEVRDEDVGAEGAGVVAAAVLPQQQLTEERVLAQHRLGGAKTAARIILSNPVIR